MFVVDIDVAKNRLYLSINGIVEKNTPGQIIAEVAVAMQKLKPRFDIVFSGMEYIPVITDVEQVLIQDAFDNASRIVMVVENFCLLVNRCFGFSFLQKGKFYYKTTSVAKADLILDTATKFKEFSVN